MQCNTLKHVFVPGSHDNHWKLRAPIGAFDIQQTDVDWQFCTVPQAGQGGRRSMWPRGKVLGGCSNLNFMIAVRGAPAEYDEWESKWKCTGWD
jgi:choline dehydrogenase